MLTEEHDMVDENRQIEHGKHSQEGRHRVLVDCQIVDKHHRQSEKHSRSRHSHVESGELVRRFLCNAAPHQYLTNLEYQSVDRTEYQRHDQSAKQADICNQQAREKQEANDDDALFAVLPSETVDVFSCHFLLSALSIKLQRTD